MLNEINEFREKAQEDMNALEKTLDNDNTMAKLNSVAPSDTERMAEISVNDAEKIDVCILSKDNIEMIRMVV